MDLIWHRHIGVYWKSEPSKEGNGVAYSLPPRPPLIRHIALCRPASRVSILADLLLARLHLGQDVEHVGEDFL